MPTKDALRQRIELVESRVLGVAVRVLGMEMLEHHAVATVQIGDCQRVRTYPYSRYFKPSRLH